MGRHASPPGSPPPTPLTLPASRRVLVLVTNTPHEGALLDYAASLGRRMEAGVDLLWLAAQGEPPPPLGTFHAQAVDVALVRGNGGAPWDEVKEYAARHRPVLVAVMAGGCWDQRPAREELLTRQTGCPVIKVTLKDHHEKTGVATPMETEKA